MHTYNILVKKGHKKMKLSQFKSSTKQEEKTSKEEQKTKIQGEKSKDMQSLYEQYKNMDKNSLMQELIKNVDKQKREGSFDFSALQSQVSQVLPYLTQDQQKYLMTILSQLK